MPTYLFSSPDGTEIAALVQRMDEPHRCFRNGVEWPRLWTAPQASADTKWDPASPADFVSKTKSKKGTVGDLWDKSRELSDGRERIFGKDHVKDAFLRKERKRRGCKILPSEAAANRGKTLLV